MPTERPILRLPEPRAAARKRPQPPRIPQPRGPGGRRQGERLGPSFAELAEAIARANGAVQLADDPTGIAPERALVFEVAGSIQDFARAAREAGLELIAEADLEDAAEIPEGFEPPQGRATLPRMLYTTMPTLRSAEQLLALWNAHQAKQPYPPGAAPWWRLFDRLIRLRVWGPEDRFPESARVVLEERLAGKADDDVTRIELEIWPSANRDSRAAWRREAEAKVAELGGTVVDTSSISGNGFIYEALLARMPVASIRQLLDDPNTPGGLAWLRGVQFILPQAVAEALPDPSAENDDDTPAFEPFNAQAPIRAAVLDGTPVAAHPALDGGVAIEDVHNFVPRSLVQNRRHATAMASLILRGDLNADGKPVPGARLLAVPIVVDLQETARSPDDKLFVELMYVVLTRLFAGPNPLAPSVFVVNLSIGIEYMRFAGRISALARLIDWWAQEHGVLFVISSGNILDALLLEDTNANDFLAAPIATKRAALRQGLRAAGYARCLTSPAEALNGITVGAISQDRTPDTGDPLAAGVVDLIADGQRHPAVSSALGLGPFRSIKPDLLETGGVHQFRATADGTRTRVSQILDAKRGLVVASPRYDAPKRMRRSRGTSCAAALMTRSILQAAAALTEDGGPFAGQDLPRQDLALLTRALAVNAAQWSEQAEAFYEETRERLGPNQTVRAKEDVARYFGHGYLDTLRMLESPERGATFVAIGQIRKDEAKIFELPLPPSLSGDRIPRSMRVTLAWFSPTDGARARYRLATLHAIAADTVDDIDEDKDKGWGLLLKAECLDDRMIGRGTVWSRRLIHDRLACPVFQAGNSIPIRVQCRDASSGGLSPDLDIRFALAVTLEVEAEVQYDVHEEIRAQLAQRIRGPG